jgi:hypothetical protein
MTDWNTEEVDRSSLQTHAFSSLSGGALKCRWLRGRSWGCGGGNDGEDGVAAVSQFASVNQFPLEIEHMLLLLAR